MLKNIPESNNSVKSSELNYRSYKWQKTVVLDSFYANKNDNFFSKWSYTLPDVDLFNISLILYIFNNSTNPQRTTSVNTSICGFQIGQNLFHLKKRRMSESLNFVSLRSFSTGNLLSK